MLRTVAPLTAVLFLGACVQPYQAAYVPRFDPPSQLRSQDQTAHLEEQDRIRRFQRLASTEGIVQPGVEEVTLPPGSVDFMAGPVPVVRVVFPERAFFAFDSAIPLPGSGPILDVIAADMQNDVPDAALTILGHTDAIGTDAYNIDLSRRRAAAVMTALVARHVRADQLTEVAIGKRLPIAPNDTPDGRALNRRVEFLISPAVAANLAAVQQFAVPERYLDTESPDVIHQRRPIRSASRPASAASVYQLDPQRAQRQPDAPDEQLRPVGSIVLTAPSVEPVVPRPTMPTDASLQSPTLVVPRPTTPTDASLQSPPPVLPAPVRPTAPVEMVPISPVEPRPASPPGSGPDSF